MGDWTDLLPRPGQGSGIPEAILAQQIGRSNIAQNDAQTQSLNIQNQQAGVQAQRQQSFQADVANYLAITDPKKQTSALAGLIAKYPEQKDALAKSWGVQDQAKKSADFGWMGGVVAAFDNNKPEIAREQLKRRRAADAAAGLDTSNDDDWLAAIESGDPKAIAYVRGAMLANMGAIDPDRFAANYKTAAEAGSPFTLSPGQERVDPITGAVTAKAAFAPRVIPVTQPDGSIKYVEYTPGGETGTTAPGTVQPYSGGPVTLDIVRPLFSAQESGGSYTARNPETGAMGRWQVMPDTGKKLAKRLGIEWRPDRMLHDSPEDRQYQDKIGDAAMAEAVAVGKGDPAKVFSYYYSGNANAYKNPKGNPKTAKYVSDMMGRLAGASPDAAPAGPAGTRVIATGAPKGGGGPSLDGSDTDAINNDAEAMIQNGLRMPPGSARNQQWVMAVKKRAAEIMKERNISPQDAMRGGQDFKAAQQMISGMASSKPGTPGGITRSINVSIDHLAQLKQALVALQNGNVPAFNKIKNWWQKNTGGDLPVSAEAIRAVVAGEVNKAIIGGAGALADREDLKEQLSTASSPAQIAGIIDGYAKLMAAQGQGIRRQYEVVTGRKDFDKYLSPRTARMLGAEGGAPPRVRSVQEAMKLPPGTVFIDPNGVRRKR